MPNLKTTLGAILKHGPCGLRHGDNCGWDKLTAGLGTRCLETEVTIKQILEINGVQDAFWALRCWDCEKYCILLTDVAESVLPIFETRFSDDNCRRTAIEAIRKYAKNEITLYEFLTADAAAAAAYAYAAAYADAVAVAAVVDYAVYNAVYDNQWKRNEQFLIDWIKS